MKPALRKALIEAIEKKITNHGRDLDKVADTVLLDYCRSARLTTQEHLEQAGFKAKEAAEIVEWVYDVPKRG